MGNPMDKVYVFFTLENLSRLIEAGEMQTILLLLTVHLCLRSQLTMLCFLGFSELQSLDVSQIHQPTFLFCFV